MNDTKTTIWKRVLIAAAAAVSVFLYVLFWYHATRPITLTVGVYAGSYWGTSIGDSYRILDEAIRIFEEKHPAVRIRYVSGIGKNDYSEWIAEQIVKGREPDIFFVLPEDFSLLANTGALLPLDDLIREDGQFQLSVYYEACRKAGQMGDSQYALPYESVPTLMFVNKSLLTKYHISMPAHSWTWEDFYDICVRIGNESAREEEKAYGSYNYRWTDMLCANDAVLFSEDGKKCYLGSHGVRDSVLFYKKLNDLNEGYTVTSRDFDDGRVAFRPFLFSDYKMYQPYPWRVKKYSNFEWDCVEMPSGPQGRNVCEIQSTMIGVSARTRKKELAWEFLKLLSADEELQKKLYFSSLGISPLIAVAEAEAILNDLFKDIPGDYAINRDVIHEIMSTGVSAPRFRRYRQAMIMAESEVESALKSGRAIEEHLLNSQHEINIMLEQ